MAFVTSTRCVIPQCALRESSGARHDCDCVGFGVWGNPRVGHAPPGVESPVDLRLGACRPLGAPFGVEYTSGFGPAESPDRHPARPLLPALAAFRQRVQERPHHLSRVHRLGDARGAERRSAHGLGDGPRVHRKYKTRRLPPRARRRGRGGRRGRRHVPPVFDPSRGIARAPRSNTSTRGIAEAQRHRSHAKGDAR